MVELEKTVTSERFWCVPARPDSRTASVLTPMGSMGLSTPLGPLLGPSTPPTAPSATRSDASHRRGGMGTSRHRERASNRRTPSGTCGRRLTKVGNVGGAPEAHKRSRCDLPSVRLLPVSLPTSSMTSSPGPPALRPARSKVEARSIPGSSAEVYALLHWPRWGRRYAKPEAKVAAQAKVEAQPNATFALH